MPDQLPEKARGEGHMLGPDNQEWRDEYWADDFRDENADFQVVSDPDEAYSRCIMHNCGMAVSPCRCFWMQKKERRVIASLLRGRLPTLPLNRTISRGTTPTALRKACRHNTERVPDTFRVRDSQGAVTYSPTFAVPSAW